MNTLIYGVNDDIISAAERAERAVLKEQLRNLTNLKKQVCNLIAQAERRLAEIEAAQAAREREAA